MNKKQIIEYITPVFLQSGYRSLTMDDVASELAISKKTLYKVFSSKERLVHAVMEGVSCRIKEMTTEIQSQDLDAMEEFLTLRSRFKQFFTGQQQQRCVYELKRYFPKVYKTSYNNQLEQILSFLRQNLLRGKASGIYRKEIDEERMTHMFAAVMLGIKTSDVELTSEEFEEVTDDFSEVFMRGISTPLGIDQYEKLINTYA